MNKKAIQLVNEFDNGEFIAHTNQWKEEASKELLRLHQINQELVSALSEAVLLIGDWGAYASEYFQNKHDLAGDINRLNSIIATATKEQNES